MKKKLLYVGAFLLTASIFTSCEGILDNCKTCTLNTYENGVLINSARAAEYCDSDLIAIQATPDVTVGTTVTKWECE